MTIPIVGSDNRTRLAGAVLVFCVLQTMLLAQGAPPEQAAVAQQIAVELAGVQAGITPAMWLQAHPTEKLQPYNGRQLANDTEKWCARTAVRHAPASGPAWTRTVYFYDPAAPLDDALPPPGSSPRQLLENTCQIGLVWIEIPETDPATGIALAQNIATALTSQYGGAQSSRMPGGFGSAGWTEVQQWQANGAVITAAYDQFAGRGRRALVRMALPNSDAIHDLPAETEQTRIQQHDALQEVIRRVERAGMPAAITAQMLALLGTADFFSGKDLPRDSQVVEAFRHWIAAAKSMPADVQAMSLLAADCTLDFLDHNGVQMGDQARAQMSELGASYLDNELAGGPVYAHGLLRQAKAIAPPGNAANAVLLLEMERGFDETGMCGGGPEEFSQVIHKGESLLAGARSLPPETIAALHFMVADAYATIVWLATTSDTEYHDPKKYQPQAESARQKALEHYRAALLLQHGTAQSHAAWREAWRLAAGLEPTSGRYFCVYD